MGNEKIRPYYDRMAASIKDPLETRNKAPDFSRYDIAYMREFFGRDRDLLDLGAGSGLLLNHIAHEFRRVVAVELYEKFSQFITPAPHLTVVNQDILGFETTESFDVIILFGVMNFFSETEAQGIYRKLRRFAKPGAHVVVKNQMGAGKDVFVDRFSEELQQNYYSEYRSPDSECRLIANAGFEIKRVDEIYPEAFNRWPDTRFKAIVAQNTTP